MRIREIYQKYSIPPILQDHMMTVAALGYTIASHWTSTKNPVDKALIAKTLLIHDMGNIIKFNLDDNPLLPSDEVDHWRRVQKDFIKKYGTNEHIATVRIAQELAVADAVVQYLKDTVDIKTALRVLHSDWDFKIMFYADFRVSPQGIVSLDERVSDLLMRYKDTHSSLWSQQDKAEELKKIVKEVENELQKHVDIPIRNQEISSYLSYPSQEF